LKRITALTVGLIVAAITAAAADASATSTASLPVLALSMNGGKSITATSTVPAGAVNVVSTVTGEPAGSPTLVRLNPGVTFPQAFGAVAAHHGDPNALDGLATIVFNPEASQGTSSAQTVLTAGNYVALDSTNNNPAKWPVAKFTVTPNSTPATLPAAQATMKMEEFFFAGPSKLHDGELVRFQNAGYLYHMVIAIPVKNKANAAKLTAALLAGKDSKAQKLASGAPAVFVGIAGPGAMQQQVINAKPGMYVLTCFMNTQDGREHTRLGMERTIKIVK
jgi:hypothetical protein